jgi:Protein of unknown function (DUF2842)
MTATSRKAVGMLGLILGLVIYAGLVGAIMGAIGRLPVVAEILAYGVLGIAWILPVKPLFIWMETGRWRLNDHAKG